MSNKQSTTELAETQDTTCSVHWFKHTLHPQQHCGSVHEQAADVLTDVIEDGQQLAWEDRNGHHGYMQGMREIATGITIESHPANGGNYCTVTIPGRACEILGVEGLQEYKQRIDALPELERDTMKRIDTPLDASKFSPKDVYDHIAENPDGVHMQAQRQSVSVQQTGFGDDQETTVYVGSRTSNRHLCIYDQRGPTRVEMRFRDNWAEKAWDHLCDEGVKSIPGMIRDFLDFADWQEWQDVMHDVGAVRLRACSSVQEAAQEVLERGRDWVDDTCRGFARALHYEASRTKKDIMDVVYSIIARGEQRMDFDDYSLIAAATGDPVPEHMPGRYQTSQRTCPF